MPLPARKHFPVDEVAQAWGTTTRMLLEYGAEALIEISVPLFGTHAELCFDIEGQGACTLSNQEVLWGTKALLAEDLWRLRGYGSASITRVKGDEEECWYHLSNAPMEVTLIDLVITAAERTRFENEHGLIGHVSEAELFTHSADYKQIVFRGRQFILSTTRAGIVRVLHEAWQAGSPWVKCEDLLRLAGSTASRVVDVFNPVADWRTIAHSDYAGNWRLNLPDPPQRRATKRAFRRPLLRLVR